ncbi:MAG: DegT/DnrJ/EryC1/StrS aminotransferase family protein [Acidimicrobiales bacterium]|nr:DegT/DnrJ/EryC1/StrS aminotransferase family protein [Hyphomonadaceae bacterium]RZV41884.1 MAG: DegT/DnrJ/EryC1/StrS aminotransferase family protein [Acidimicrobiales bacterium]
MDFIDLKSQQARISDKINAGIASVLEHGRYILGPEVTQLENALAAFGDAQHAVSCANGTDALILPMMAWGIGPGDAVFCPSFTYVATAEAVALLGATPVFIDVDRKTYNMDAQSLKTAINSIVRTGELTPKAIIAVDLFGQSADYSAIAPIAKEHGLKLIADSAQGFGSSNDGKQPLHWCDVATTSFFPAKPLGCYGDGGAILTNDTELVEVLKSIRMHGAGVDKYDNVRVGLNSRLDSIQAAILIEKLKIFEDEIKKRMAIAKRYNEALNSGVRAVPTLSDGAISTWAQYTIEVDHRDEFMAHMRAHDIPTASYYPRPVHMQSAYAHYPVSGNGLANTEDAMKYVVSLPMHAYLSEDDQDQIVDAVLAFKAA